MPKLKVEQPVMDVLKAMVQAFIDRADPDNTDIAKQTAMDYLNDMTYGEIKKWALNITLDDDPMVVKFNPDNYSFYITSTEEDETE